MRLLLQNASAQFSVTFPTEVFHPVLASKLAALEDTRWAVGDEDIVPKGSDGDTEVATLPEVNAIVNDWRNDTNPEADEMLRPFIVLVDCDPKGPAFASSEAAAKWAEAQNWDEYIRNDDIDLQVMDVRIMDVDFLREWLDAETTKAEESDDWDRVTWLTRLIEDRGVTIER